jgi:MFS family permease
MEVFLALFLLLLLVGLALALIIGLAAGVLFVCSSSLLVGLYRRSVSSGLKTFLLLSCGSGGMITGVILLFFINNQGHWQMTTGRVLGLGLGSGLAAGVVLGLLAFQALAFGLEWAKRRLARS